MITKEQAILLGAYTLREELHYDTCKCTIGPRGGKKYRIERWRVNGKCKTWKTRPDDFLLPIKTVFRGPYSYLTNTNCMHYHLASDCPLNKEDTNEMRNQE